ncbi:MAG: Gfo/Idh/MocA family oxidoreductase [Candidatus Sulfopaludibacter sp.]|nr:Gfo/Idh/MocA family oxidoreductase [Candidatus Sulfopaludibacter sp.]
MAPESPDRRRFLKTAGGAVLASALFTGDFHGANDRINLAFIGTGRMGSRNIGYAAQVPGFKTVAVCDVYRPTLASAAEKASRLGRSAVKAVEDFREILADKSIDAVSIAAPDHWHACMAIEACKAGKDVWVETPACVYVEEGVKMVEAARRYQRVVQGGTVERSGGLSRQVRAIVKRGELGDIAFCHTFQTISPDRAAFGNPPDADPPPGLDWDMWLGPAPKRPFNANRWSAFRHFWDYSGGAVTDEGVHLLDIVQSAFDEAMPGNVAAQGGKFYVTGNTETADTVQATYRYPGFVASYQCRIGSAGDDDTCGAVFHGTRATLAVNRSGYAIYPNQKGAAAQVVRHHEMAAANVAHWKNFRESVRSRRKPASDIETCVRSTVTCLLANIALRQGMNLRWDDRAFTVKQSEARPFLKAPYRAPWKLEV